MRSFSIMILIFSLLLITGCTRDPYRQSMGDLAITLSTNPNPARLGENVLNVKLMGKDGQAVEDAQVLFSYFMPYEKVPVIPEHYVATKDATINPDKTYAAKVSLGKGGDWKISVTIRRPNKPEVVAWFTVKVISSSS